MAEPFMCHEVGCTCSTPVKLKGIAALAAETQREKDSSLYKWAVADAAKKGVDLSALPMGVVVGLVRTKLREG